MTRAYATAKIPPPRNVYFASVTAEEQGLLGSNAQRYHRPNDEYQPNMDFRTDARLAQFGFLLGWQALSSAPVT
jgi:Zn-dependent M28 family amino/carboxypeptidase